MKANGGIEIKRFGNSYYVYRSTTYRDREAKKRRKRSTYPGKLDKDRGGTHFSRPEASVSTQSDAESDPAYQSGLWRDLAGVYALATTRILGYTALKRVGSVRVRLHDPNRLTPDLRSKKLSAVLKEIGSNRAGHDLIFRELSKDGRQFVYDLSVVFTRSEGINIAEMKRQYISVKQLNYRSNC